jgi:hypothetical protein
MTFQNFISRIPKWNQTIIKDETNRIKEASGCGYLEDLVTCVHIIKLKALTCARVGQKQKKINIDIPPLESFIHKIYINVARKLYTNVYLFENNVKPLQIQKHNREFETIIKESILLTIRDSIPVEDILRAYLDETQETDVEVEEKVEIIEKELEVENKVVAPTPDTYTPRHSVIPSPVIPPPSSLPPPPHPLPQHSSDFETKGGNSNDNNMNYELNNTKPIISNFKENTNSNSIEYSRPLFKDLSLSSSNNNISQFSKTTSNYEDDEERINIGNDISLDELQIDDLSVSNLEDDINIDFELLN